MIVLTAHVRLNQRAFVRKVAAAGGNGRLVVGDNLFGPQSDVRVVRLAEQQRVSTMDTVESYVRAGGLPLDLPTRYPLLVNGGVAQRPGITVSAEIVARVMECVH